VGQHLFSNSRFFFESGVFIFEDGSFMGEGFMLILVEVSFIAQFVKIMISVKTPCAIFLKLDQ